MMQNLVGKDRASAVRAGVRIEMFTVAWMGVEAALAIGAGVLARSVLLTAFGLDSDAGPHWKMPITPKLVEMGVLPESALAGGN